MPDPRDDAALLRTRQFAFAAHLRDPSRHPPPPGIEDRRMAVYRDLFRNSIDSLLAANFPVIRRTLDDARWQRLVAAFHAEYRAQTPLFTEVAREFIDFLQTRDADAGDPPWLAELAHYEWVELALQISDAALPPHQADGDLMDGVPVLSPLAWPLRYAWPVQRIGPDNQPEHPPDTPTLLLVRRDAAGNVRFSELSPLVYVLLESIADNTTANGAALLRALADEAGIPADDAFMQQGEGMLQRMRDEDTLLGTRADPANGSVT